MAKIGFITDTHWGQHNDNQVFYDYMKKAVEYYFTVFEEQGVEIVIHGGDVVDRRKFINYVTALRLREDFLKPLSERFKKTYFICGNHDVYYKDTNKVNALNILRLDEFSNFEIHEKWPHEITVDGADILLLPWITVDNEEKAYEAVSNSKAKTCIGHLEVIGATMDKYGQVADHGLSPFLLEQFESVYTGHFHHPSVKGNVHYVGAAFELDWNDYNDPRGVTIIDPVNHTREFFQCPYKLFRNYHYADSTEKKINLLKQDIDRGYFKKFSDCFVKLRVQSKNDDMIYEEVYKQINDAGPASFKTEDQFEPTEDEQTDIDLTNVDSTQTILSRYIEKRMPDEMKKGVASNVNELYNEAIQLENITL